MILEAKALFLVVAANAGPILIRRLPVLAKYTYPVDFGVMFSDGRRLLGPTKTWRGISAAILLTTLCSGLLLNAWLTGLIVGSLAMLGDSLSSFLKRRLAIPPSHMALGIDQIPESLLPLMYLQSCWHFDVSSVWLLVLIFFILELLISRILYRLHIRKQPY